MMLPLQAHPAAELFPLLGDSEFESFKADIAARGLIEPIWLCEGKILDGRNRYRACHELDIEVRTREYSGDSPVAFVWSLNGTRRQLSKSQLAAVAANMLPALEEEAKKRQQVHGETAPGRPKESLPPKVEEVSGEAAAVAAKLVGVSKSYVHDAKRVKKTAPELFAQVEAGKMPVAKALKLAKQKPLDPSARNQPREQRAANIKRLAGEGHRAEQIAAELNIGVQHVREIARDEGITLPDAHFGKTRAIKVRRVIEETINGLAGYALGLQTISGAISTIDPADAKEWAASIAESIKPINLLRKQLLEIANG